MKKIVSAIVAVLLVVCCLPFVVNYIKWLHLIVMIGGVVTIVMNVQHGWCWENIVLGIIVVLFCPIMPMQIFSRWMWVLMYVIMALFFCYVGFKRDEDRC